MQTFQDSAGRSYSLTINIDAVAAVKSLLGFSLTSVGRSNPLVSHREKRTDLETVIDTVFVLVMADATRYGLSDVEWVKVMPPKLMFAAIDAFFVEWSDYLDELYQPFSARLVSDSRLKFHACAPKNMRG